LGGTPGWEHGGGSKGGEESAVLLGDVSRKKGEGGNWKPIISSQEERLLMIKNSKTGRWGEMENPRHENGIKKKK